MFQKYRYIMIKTAFKNSLPIMEREFANITADLDTENEQSSVEAVYKACDSISVDYGIMERARNVEVYPAPFDWSDVGTWNALYDIQNKDENNNVIKAKKILLRNTHGSLIYLNDEKFVAINGVSDLIVVESEDSLLIANRNDEQAVKEVVNVLKKNEDLKKFT
ncbi:MAG: mannose-1-phosphate guanylyltransferase, partial [Bacteroidia bacterium]